MLEHECCGSVPRAQCGVEIVARDMLMENLRGL